ncbi:uncharacterized protein LOC131218862 [Magnolia sinica]|uniref:uncharacterized protein LOC131218862 n=1 Tax=Magnolia sinica TaxID=86752 RepID=UPI002659F784|nr:uncharacterized protein LOC131218862 [Magnolia sinica]
MSWLARSLANSLISDHNNDHSEDSDEDEKQHSLPRNDHNEKDSEQQQQQQQSDHYPQSIASDGESPNTAGGVKEDLSEITKSLTRQFWGVASFLAPPPTPPHPSTSDSNPPISSDPSVSQDPDLDSSATPPIAGIRSDFAEIGGKFRTGISRLSNNKAVTGFSKIASSFLPFGSDEKDSVGEAVGVTDEVLAFARNISMHPETWLDFPLFVDDDYSDDFDMSDAQQEHALAVEHLAPRLAALRIELCPGHMSEGCFWMIYFVLLHSRLSKHDAELLSTPQIVEARAMWLQELQNRTKPESDRFGRGISYTKDAADAVPEERFPTANVLSETTPIATFAFEPTSSVSTTDIETDKHPVVTSETRIIDKSVVEEGTAIQTKSKDLPTSASKPLDQEYDDEGDDWLEEDNSEMGGATIPLGNEEDVSFSDLEDDYDGSAPTSSKTLVDTSDSSTNGSRGWVQLDKSSGDAAKGGRSISDRPPQAGQSNASHETKESSDWLSVDDIDVV